MPGSFNVPLRVALFSAALGITLLGGIIAAYFKRKRRPVWRDISVEGSISSESAASEKGKKKPIHGYIERTKSTDKTNSSPPSRQTSQANGDIHSNHMVHWSESAACASPSISTATNDDTDATLVDETGSMSTIIAAQVDIDKLPPDKVTELGMEQFQSAIRLWEKALQKIEDQDEGDDVVDSPLEDLQYQLGELLERAYKIQDAVESKLFSSYSTEIAINAAIQEMDREYEDNKRRSLRSLHSRTDSSSDISFMSAVSHIDLSDLEDHKGLHPQYGIYEAALLELEHTGVWCYAIRTKLLMCSSDSEFLAKLHCVRAAFQEMFLDESIRNYFIDCGRQIISDLLVKADRDPEEFQQTYSDLIAWVSVPDNWPDMETELRGRGVKMMTFYDIVIDFLIFDAFDDLANPPSSVITVTQNRWLSNGFKETALSTAVWSVLKAKKRMLKRKKPVSVKLPLYQYLISFPRGFIAHFYNMSEHTSPVLAWGFLGPDTPLKKLCYIFKDEVLSFMRAVFSFDSVRYTTLAELTDDINRLARERLLATMNAVSGSIS